MNTRIIPLALFIFLSVPSFAQTCSFEESSTDKFTGKKHRLSEKTVIAKHVKGDAKLKISEFYMVFKQEGDAYTLKLGYKTAKTPVLMNAGNQIILLLNNQEKIALTVNNFLPSMTNSGLKGDYSYWFDISTENMQKIKATRITDIRVAAQVNPVDIEIDETAGVDIMTMAGCMLSE
ncbi:hypothetical protein [Taibaiella soli]|uniref:Auto-transporter adhesin head GIN domain-containing protein n=1 Tax=Taibaiella soli TaxID=1649169 RepID=A0A2W2BJB6_9BACT|nr:hypothetical protein [Taibaiella soli]PZF73536.1 hypothetical protein DN068_07365 [Taibaiella soli]